TWAWTAAASGPASRSARSRCSSSGEGQGVIVGPQRGIPEGRRARAHRLPPGRQVYRSRRNLTPAGAVSRPWRSGLLQAGDLLLEHLLHPALGLVDAGHGQPEAGGGVGPRHPLHGPQPASPPRVAPPAPPPPDPRP